MAEHEHSEKLSRCLGRSADFSWAIGIRVLRWTPRLWTWAVPMSSCSCERWGLSDPYGARAVSDYTGRPCVLFRITIRIDRILGVLVGAGLSCPQGVHMRVKIGRWSTFDGSVWGCVWYGVLNAAYRGRSEMFDPFEPLTGSPRIAGRRPSLQRVEGRDSDLGTPLIIRDSDAETDCDRPRFIMRTTRRIASPTRLPDRLLVLSGWQYSAHKPRFTNR